MFSGASENSQVHETPTTDVPTSTAYTWAILYFNPKHRSFVAFRPPMVSTFVYLRFVMPAS